MDETALQRLAADISFLMPDAAIDARSLKLLIDKYGTAALGAGSPNHGIAALYEIIELVKRLERGGVGIEKAGIERE